MIISHSVLLRMIYVSEKFVEKIKTGILCSIAFFLSRAVYEITWNKYCRARQTTMTRRCIGIAYWIYWKPKAKNTHIGCVIIIAFPLQQWMHEHVSLLLYPYTACQCVICTTFWCISALFSYGIGNYKLMYVARTLNTIM